MKPPWSTLGRLFLARRTMGEGESMAKTDRLPPLTALMALEERAAAIILNVVNKRKTEQETLKALKADGLDVRRLPLRFVVTKIEDRLKAARLAANALRVPRKRKSPN